MGLFLKPVKISLDGIPYLKCINCTTQHGVICKLAEGCTQSHYVVDEDIKKYWSQYGPLRDTTRYWFLLGHEPLTVTLDTAIQPIPDVLTDLFCRNHGFKCKIVYKTDSLKALRPLNVPW